MAKFTIFGCLSGVTAVVVTLFSAPMAGAQEEVDFSKGVFIINEDWFGHNNSTVNYLLPDATDGNYWHYRVIKSNNTGKELGASAESGEIWNGKFYIVCKQSQDPSSSIVGGRLTVVDAKTMKLEYQLTDIATATDGGEAVDGRSFLGVNEHKGYVSSSNGVWILDLDSHEITGHVEGTGNEDGSLYTGQSGTMVRAAGKVFVAHQSLGLLVVDPTEDKVVQTISFDIVEDGAGIGSVVVAKDGSLWCSVASDGNGGTLPYLLRVDPETLATEVLDIPSTVYAPANSWYAWTPDGFCASSVTNTLYWNGGSQSWASGSEIFKFNVDTHAVERIINFDEEGEGWSVYGCSMRVHPETDEIYMSLNKNWSDSYVVRRYTADGQMIQEYPMIANYWFPALPVFAQSDGLSGVADIRLELHDDVEISAVSGSVLVLNAAGKQVEVYTLSGSLLYSQSASSDTFIVADIFVPGVYVVKAGTAVCKVRL